MFILVLPRKENKLHPIYRTIKSQDNFTERSQYERLFPLLFCTINKNSYLCKVTNKEITNMLGIKSHRPPIEGDIADEIRDAVVRVAKGQLNEEEKAVQERLKKALEKYEVKWEL
jgi:capsular polysaccharide biosynthesis protein